ncbi:hypothetical protein PIGHUM_00933 [Pigmentiphaga humi]|uniref:Uncharacterized protein n=1 Tax=Pigmentiphaga humi TaxID=2478468 RepID=A0A3P4AXS0_9BURK|nr:hypothetical protein [Pigmentiphaga humi]VCU68874.1 hypothetical protein PIGHUM_00933 [Pigmentiphaga humi]
MPTPSASLRLWCPVCLDFHAHFVHPRVYERTAPHSVSTGFGTRQSASAGARFERLLKPEIQIDDMPAASMPA